MIGKIALTPAPGGRKKLGIFVIFSILRSSPVVGGVSGGLKKKRLRFLTYVHPGGQSLEGDFSTLAAAVEAWDVEMVMMEKSMVDFLQANF